MADNFIDRIRKKAAAQKKPVPAPESEKKKPLLDAAGLLGKLGYKDPQTISNALKKKKR